MKFRKRPVVVEAEQWKLGKEIESFFNQIKGASLWVEDISVLLIPTLEGTMKAQSGDWVIKGVNGEFYPCKPDIFEKTYELAE